MEKKGRRQNYESDNGEEERNDFSPLLCLVVLCYDNVHWQITIALRWKNEYMVVAQMQHFVTCDVYQVSVGAYFMSEGNPLSSVFFIVGRVVTEEMCIGGRGLELWTFDDF